MYTCIVYIEYMYIYMYAIHDVYLTLSNSALDLILICVTYMATLRH